MLILASKQSNLSGPIHKIQTFFKDCGVLGFWGFGVLVIGLFKKFCFLNFLNEKHQGGSYEVVFIFVLWMVSSES